jgi:hypothetical protein
MGNIHDFSEQTRQNQANRELDKVPHRRRGRMVCPNGNSRLLSDQAPGIAAAGRTARRGRIRQILAAEKLGTPRHAVEGERRAGSWHGGLDSMVASEHGIRDEAPEADEMPNRSPGDEAGHGPGGGTPLHGTPSGPEHFVRFRNARVRVFNRPHGLSRYEETQH